MGRKLSKKELNGAIIANQAKAANITFLNKEDEDAMVRVYADAFTNDPMWLWVAGLDDDDPKRNEKMYNLARYMLTFISIRFLNGRAGAVLGVKDGQSGELVGCMSVCPSSCSPETFLGTISGIIRLGMPPMYKKKEKKEYCPMSAKRLELLDKLKKARRKHTKKTPKYIYLQSIGVLSAQHGKGYGGKLLRTLTKAADSLGVPIYLETEAPELESMYQHFGFRTVERMVLKVPGDTRTDACHTMYLMLRDA